MPDSVGMLETMAGRRGADAIELDVRLTADGAPVVIHDATLDRTTDRTGPVAALTLAELRAVDAGWQFTPDRAVPIPAAGATCTFQRSARCSGPFRG